MCAGIFSRRGQTTNISWIRVGKKQIMVVKSSKILIQTKSSKIWAVPEVWEKRKRKPLYRIDPNRSSCTFDHKVISEYKPLKSVFGKPKPR